MESHEELWKETVGNWVWHIYVSVLKMWAICWLENSDCCNFLYSRQPLYPDLLINYVPDSKVYGANMGASWALSAPGGPLVGPMNIVIRGVFILTTRTTGIDVWPHFPGSFVDLTIRYVSLVVVTGFINLAPYHFKSSQLASRLT